MNNSQLSSSSRSLELKEDLLIAERIISLVADTLERERLYFHHAQTIPALLAYAYRQRARVTPLVTSIPLVPLDPFTRPHAIEQKNGLWALC